MEKALSSRKGSSSSDLNKVELDQLRSISSFNLLNFYNSLLVEGHSPKAWDIGVIVPIPKKGDLTDPANYRGITLHLIVQKKGFGKGRQTMDNIFLIRVLREPARAPRKPLRMAFIELVKAFDTLDRALLMAKVRMMGGSGKVIWAIEALYCSTSRAIRSRSRYSDCFDFDHGVIQGDPISPTLFALFFTDLETDLYTLHWSSNTHGYPSPLPYAGRRRLTIGPRRECFPGTCQLSLEILFSLVTPDQFYQVSSALVLDRAFNLLQACRHVIGRLPSKKQINLHHANIEHYLIFGAKASFHWSWAQKEYDTFHKNDPRIALGISPRSMTSVPQSWQTPTLSSTNSPCPKIPRLPSERCGTKSPGMESLSTATTTLAEWEEMVKGTQTTTTGLRNPPDYSSCAPTQTMLTGQPTTLSVLNHTRTFTFDKLVRTPDFDSQPTTLEYKEAAINIHLSLESSGFVNNATMTAITSRSKTNSMRLWNVLYGNAMESVNTILRIRVKSNNSITPTAAQITHTHPIIAYKSPPTIFLLRQQPPQPFRNDRQLNSLLRRFALTGATRIRLAGWQPPSQTTARVPLLLSSLEIDSLDCALETREEDIRTAKGELEVDVHGEVVHCKFN
ncbi:hypothetical protein G7K_5883-t1 [Saitoella complicata NRRL Y-17804]|uniref:Uncharacterized protein n=1 Tax=Saitoella complicata (strain BCRC 22490 / CBS 7301 / JCM 7358 / NBRC 10748 / NRRL Y-17804) TaxID=698492 RepID=A0A0E9NPI6_SAICN|nr:hypothetical protein G7K_5883-t1 [Saitoella complicata NRRL Y-17804]